MKPTYLALAASLTLGAMAVTVAPAAAQTVLKIGLQDDPDTLDPVSNWSFVGRHVLQSLCDKIVDIDQNGKIIPMLAASIGMIWPLSSMSTILSQSDCRT